MILFVECVIRYDAHPMSMLTSAFAMLGSYYSEANPSLQGKSTLLLSYDLRVDIGTLLSRGYIY